MGPDFTLTPLLAGRTTVCCWWNPRRAPGAEGVLHDPDDPRDRFGRNRALYRLAWDHGLRGVPEPLGWDVGQRLGLFGHVEGRKLRPDEVTERRVGEAIEFVCGLNARREALGP